MMKKQTVILVLLLMLLSFPTVSFAIDLPSPVNGAFYENHLEEIASDARIAGPNGNEHYTYVKNYCARELKNFGYQIEMENFCRLALTGYYCGTNVIGTKEAPSESPRKNEIVYISAHYDSVDTDDLKNGGKCKSADDNASAIAGVLESARILSKMEHERTLKVVCWDREEEGTVGSLYHAKQSRLNNENIIVSYVYEMIGYTNKNPYTQGLRDLSKPANKAFYDTWNNQWEQIVTVNQDRADFLMVVYNSGFWNEGMRWIESSGDSAAFMENAAAASGLKLITLPFNPYFAILPNYAGYGKSDHLAFWNNSFPAMMITDTSVRNPNYHCKNGESDDIDTLDIDFALKAVDAVTYSALQILNP